MKYENRIYLNGNDGPYYVPYILDNSPECVLYGNGKVRPAVVVCPGGGYEMTSDREAEPIALALAAQGYHTFVLRYSVGKAAGWPAPQVDLMKTMASIREHAQEWSLDPDKIALCGFSAGGHLAASLGVYWNDEELLEAAGVTAEQAKPNALILHYPVISLIEPAHLGSFGALGQGLDWTDDEIRQKFSLELHVGKHTPPCYIMHTYFDSMVPIENSLCFARALAKNDVPFEMHIFQDGEHGLALANAVTYNNWTNLHDEYGEWPVRCGLWLNKLFGYQAPDTTRTESGLTRRRH